MTPIPKEAFSLREIMMEATGARYEIREVLPEQPAASHREPWYLLEGEFRGPRGTGHASVVWQNDSDIFIQSMYIGNTVEWIAPIYGEKGAIEASRVDYSDFPRARTILAEKFPEFEERLLAYERIVREISGKQKAVLSIQPVGERRVVTFLLLGQVHTRGLTAAEKLRAVKQTVEALKAAWNEIDRYDSPEGQR